MKKTIIILLTIILANVAFAQRPYGCIKQGTVMEYSQYDADDDLTGISRTTIKSVKGSGNNYEVTIVTEIMGPDGTPLISPMESVTTYKDGKASVNVGSGSSGLTVEVGGDDISIPSKLAVGMLLDLGKITADISGIRTTMTITENEVIDREEITTDAGTFKCYVIKQTAESKVFGIKGVTTTKTWYARGVGAVRTETYLKGKISSSQILTKYE
ncbi:MAG: hypothetical protein PHD11_09515 [Bacteroidales bacterium]|nr:hypothetical protein [Bacteroidales bacterium]MDD4670546.1 hypothetical protein [Bacteroidales bacterium]